MKKAIYFVVLTTLSSFVSAQSLQSAKLKTASERYDEATNEYLILIKNNPDDLDNYFFLAENYLLSEKVDSAAYYWQQASTLEEKNPLSMVAKGKSLWIKGDNAGATTAFEEALKMSRRKNAEVYRQIGSFLTEAPQKDLDKAIAYLKEATELDPKSVDGFLFLGDAILEKDPANGTDAIREYNNAERIEKSPRTIVRKAKLYQRARNYKLANEMYIQAQTLDAKYAPAYKAHAELQDMFGMYDLAIANWEKYLSLNDDNYARYKYAAALYSAQKYCDAQNETQALIAKKYTSVYIERIDIYANYECLENSENKNDTSKFEAGLKTMQNFLAKYNATNEIVGMDYKYKAMYLSKTGKTQEAIDAYYKAAEDTSITKDVLSNLAKTFIKDEKYEDAVKAYSKIIDNDSSNLSLADYFDLGRVYFMVKDYVNSDKANAYVLKLSPNYSFSHFWRARANVYIDLENPTKTWSAKKHYEAYLENTKPEEKAHYKSMVLEAYRYLGDFYENSEEKDLEKAIEIWNSAIEIDPDNADAYTKRIEKIEKSK